MTPYRVVSAKIEAFNDSLPLVDDLKNEALRPRHWEELFAKTGCRFDVNDKKSFTLRTLFEMDLAKYRAEIGEITVGAVRELVIEKEIDAIEGPQRPPDSHARPRPPYVPFLVCFPLLFARWRAISVRDCGLHGSHRHGIGRTYLPI